MIRLLVAHALVISFTPGAEAQHLPTTGDTNGRGTAILGQSVESTLGSQPIQMLFAGYGISEKVDLYFGVGNGAGQWFRGVGVSFATHKFAGVTVNGSMFIRSGFRGGTDFEPRVIVRHEVTDHLNLFGGIAGFSSAREYSRRPYTPAVTLQELDGTTTVLRPESGDQMAPMEKYRAIGAGGAGIPIGVSYDVKGKLSIIAETAVGLFSARPMSGRISVAYKVKK